MITDYVTENPLCESVRYLPKNGEVGTDFDYILSAVERHQDKF